MDDFQKRLNELQERVLGKALTEEEQTNYTESLFESIKHINEYGEEFWYARDLQIALDYKRWDKFQNVIDKAKAACANSNNPINDHFSHVGKIVEAGATCKDIGDIKLSRYACYLIVQNGDSRKKVIALGQTYFAIKTRQQELIDNFEDLTEDKKRLAIRREMTVHNKSLAEAAQMAGIEDSRDYAIFQNRGYQGLYGGLGVKEIHARKGLKRIRKFLITWEALNLLLICSVQLRRTRNSVANILPKKKKRIKHITKSAKKFDKLSLSLVVQCRKIYLLQRRVLSKLSKSRKKLTANKNRPGAGNTKTVAIHPKMHTLFKQTYCIIFGTATQAEHLFVGCYFYT